MYKLLRSALIRPSDFYNENRWQKFSRRLKEEPLIPIGPSPHPIPPSTACHLPKDSVTDTTAILGCLGTCYALYCATQSIKAGDSTTTNRMFRYRIYGQAFTLVAMVAGSFYYNSDRILRREFEKVKTAQKAKEKNEAWIRELEARDREDKDWKVRMGKVREAQKEEVEKREEKARRKLEEGGGGGVVLSAVRKLKEKAQEE